MGKLPSSKGLVSGSSSGISGFGCSGSSGLGKGSHGWGLSGGVGVGFGSCGIGASAGGSSEGERGFEFATVFPLQSSFIVKLVEKAMASRFFTIFFRRDR